MLRKNGLRNAFLNMVDRTVIFRDYRIPYFFHNQLELELLFYFDEGESDSSQSQLIAAGQEQ